MQNIISFNFIILYTMITKISKRAVSSITHCTYEIFLDHKEIKIFFFHSKLNVVTFSRIKKQMVHLCEKSVTLNENIIKHKHSGNIVELRNCTFIHFNSPKYFAYFRT